MNPSNFKKFEEENDLGNKNISLNNKPTGPTQVEGKPIQSTYVNQMIGQIVKKKEDLIVKQIMKNTNVSEEVSNTVMNKINTHLQFVGKYFNVEVDDIQQKLVSSVIPMNQNFYQIAETNPDLYGPFWIYTTLIFLVTFAGNLSNYINADEEAQKIYKYNFNFIPNAALFIYGVGFGIPMAIYLMMKFMFKVDISLVLNICVYGYSFTILAPILLLCIIPSGFLETIFLLYFLAHSSYFLIYNMAKFIFEKAQASKMIIYAILLFFQVVLFLTLKFYFFGTFTQNK